jgi:hypothetical protein
MKRLLLSMAAATVLYSFTLAAQADESWIFQRSYYSHDPVTNVRIGRPAVTGGPYYTRPQGAYVRSGFRNNNITINVGSAGADVTNVWESWVQTGEQF